MIFVCLFFVMIIIVCFCFVNSCFVFCYIDIFVVKVFVVEYRCVVKYVWYDEEVDVGVVDVDLVEVGDVVVMGGDGDIFELDVYVVFG